jgi:uncharacterized OB-fold protein
MTSVSGSVPVVSYLRLDGEPRLRGQRCAACGATFLRRRNGCASCGLREFDLADLPRAGRLRTFTVVHRGTRGDPFVSAVVELDDGTVVKANLVDSPLDPDQIALGGRVELVTFTVGSDSHGTEAVAFGYRPVAGGAP